jgi:hypothetical protein
VGALGVENPEEALALELDLLVLAHLLDGSVVEGDGSLGGGFPGHFLSLGSGTLERGPRF